MDQVTAGGQVKANYTYDALERMALRVTQNMPGAGTTHTIYDLAGRLIMEADATGTSLREYIWLDDMPLAVLEAPSTPTPQLYWVHADHLDRPVKMTDGNQAAVWDAVWKPFGEPYSITSSIGLVNNMRFPGQYFLIESGLAYNWHRHYDATLGRYVQPDPLEFADGPDIYTYVKSAPTRHVDREGTFVAPFPVPPVVPLLRPQPPIPFLGPPDPTNPGFRTSRDPCEGLRIILAEHERKLREYIADPHGHDNKNLLGKGRDENVIRGRIAKLQRQIENFKKLLKECEEKNAGREFIRFPGSDPNFCSQGRS